MPFRIYVNYSWELYSDLAMSGFCLIFPSVSSRISVTVGCSTSFCRVNHCVGCCISFTIAVWWKVSFLAGTLRKDSRPLLRTSSPFKKRTAQRLSTTYYSASDVPVSVLRFFFLLWIILVYPTGSTLGIVCTWNGHSVEALPCEFAAILVSSCCKTSIKQSLLLIGSLSKQLCEMWSCSSWRAACLLFFGLSS